MFIRKIQAVVLALFLGAVTARATPPPSAADFDFSQYEGQVVILDFWASWCPPCRRSFPWFNAMKQKYGAHGLVIVGVNTDRKWEDAEHFLQQIPADFQLLSDPDGMLKEKFEVTGMPTTFIFDRHGTMVARHLGFQVAEQEDYEALLRRVLTAAPEP
jgi:cytochrome c biogenesis protein CcmG, thiol:disulfide interchange protein DsbE